MLKAIAILSAAVVAAYAQSNPLIPSGISAGCKTFLETLNTDASIASCTTALNTALASFAPGKTGASASDITSALTNVCSVSTTNACPTASINSQITGFYKSCSDELTSNANADVVRLYDVLFTIIPMKQALCSKGDNGNWCVSSGVPLSTSASDLQKSLYTESGQTVIPNTAAFASNNLPFLLINPKLESAALCTACTRNVLSAYINYESDLPYAPGLNRSQILGTQTELFNAVSEKCGARFMDNEVQAAGGLGTGNSILGGGAASLNAGFQSILATFAGFATLAVVAL
jgi:hypothetical protein